jgi:GNAT superfamily N-acetyltransferase
VTLAQTPDDHRASATLLRSLYGARGYLVSGLDADPASDLVLVASEDGEPIGTLTLRFDGPGGLRADEGYGDELGAARAAGRRVCELGRFAVVPGARSRTVIVALFRHARRLVHDRGGITDVFVEVNPRHAAFYCGGLGFSVAARQGTCRRVCAPAVLLRLDVAEFEARLRAAGGRLTGGSGRVRPDLLAIA